MLKDLVKLASRLDDIGLTKEADYLDQVIKKIAEEGMVIKHTVIAGEVFSKIVEAFGDPKYSLKDQIELNKKDNPSFNPDKLQIGQQILLYVPPEYETN